MSIFGIFDLTTFCKKPFYITGEEVLKYVGQPFMRTIKIYVKSSEGVVAFYI
jgi:hypothetical protein